MNLNKVLSTFAGVALAATLVGCEGEKDLIIIDGDLPIKTSTLYMVGDATPNGWSIDNPTPLAASEEDNLVFSWEGELYKGEIKLCLVPGSWDVGFIRPTPDNENISSTDLTDVPFQMHAGDPDEKWQVKEAGNYRLSFNLRDWTMSTKYLGENEVPDVEPLEVEQLFMVGNATPCGWNIDDPFALTKISKYVWQYEGDLKTGEFKCCSEKGSWDVSFVRPLGSNCNVSANGLEFNQMTWTAAPDNKWVVTDAGKYRLTFDLEHFILKSEYLEAPVQTDYIQTTTLYIIGDATPGGWSMDNLTALTPNADHTVFTAKVSLYPGSMKACVESDGSFSCPFLRPTFDNCLINDNGVESPDFVYTTGPDDKWKVDKAGEYQLTFNLKTWTFEANYLGNSNIRK